MMNKKILVDTNILVYAWDQKEIKKQQMAIKILETHKNQLHLSTQNLSEFSSVMMKHHCDLVWLHQVINLFVNGINIVYPTHHDVLNAIQAVRQYKMHFWDAQIWSVARNNGIEVILTEDGPIGQTIEGVTYINPF